MQLLIPSKGVRNDGGKVVVLWCPSEHPAGAIGSGDDPLQAVLRLGASLRSSSASQGSDCKSPESKARLLFAAVAYLELPGDLQSMPLLSIIK